jgi:hypothetical protein
MWFRFNRVRMRMLFMQIINLMRGQDITGLYLRRSMWMRRISRRIRLSIIVRGGWRRGG